MAFVTLFHVEIFPNVVLQVGSLENSSIKFVNIREATQMKDGRVSYSKYGLTIPFQLCASFAESAMKSIAPSQKKSVYESTPFERDSGTEISIVKIGDVHLISVKKTRFSGQSMYLYPNELEKVCEILDEVMRRFGKYLL
jgi:hypothetical protein